MATTSTKSLNPRFGRLLVLLLAGLTSLAVGACKGDGAGNDVQIKSSCKSYCEQAKLCNKDINEQNCINDCHDSMGNCMADEQDVALEKLDSCAKEACSDFTGCTIDAGAQCYFGL